MNPENHQPRVPSLAGICSFEDAEKPGLSVNDCVTRLKRYHYAFKRLHGIFNDRLTAEPLYELKMAFSLHSHLCAEHATALRVRVGEMREPPLGLEQVPHAGLERFFDAILSAPTTAELVLGIYEKALPPLKQALQNHLRDTNHLVDHPSVRLCRFALLELADMLGFGQRCVDALVDRETRSRAEAWLGHLDVLAAAAGGVDGTENTPAAGADSIEAELPDRFHSETPHVFDGIPRRDGRFTDPYNMGVNAEVFLYDPSFPADAKVLMMFYKRLREIDVPEMMAGIIAETTGKPWEYRRAMTRQLWDEARHAMMGDVGFRSLGIEWPEKVMVNFTWSLALNSQLKPIERHAVLYFIEQGLMPRTGKRYEWEVARAAGNELAAMFQDYDWADEVLHAKIGRDWYLPEFDQAKKAVEYGDKCWSKVLLGWRTWKDEGLTLHRNWWPELYRDYCAKAGIEPDAHTLAYATSYEEIRADLKNISASG